MYAVPWADLPEVEVLPNNYRRAVAGLEVGINLVRWEHPSGTPPHVHDDAEKAVIVLEGTMEWLIAGQALQLDEGDVAVVPRGVEHSGRTTGARVRFYEAFAPSRVQNLVGFLGQGLLPPAGNEPARPEREGSP
ncbi:MAG: cupin domain-containing protein [Actinomycetota bacterium]|nr:cupin domain-containing protein [Actinomycetota bacterium]